MMFTLSKVSSTYCDEVVFIVGHFQVKNHHHLAVGIKLILHHLQDNVYHYHMYPIGSVDLAYFVHKS